MKEYNSVRTSFIEYLKRRSLTPRTISSFDRVAVLFLKWLEKEQMKVEQVSYRDILSFMKSCQKQVSQRTVQLYLNVIRHYYDHLIEENKIEINPVEGIKVQGVKRKALYHIFEPHELHAIYNSYQDETLKGKRNKIMLSLLVYQGVKTEELIKLEVQNVKTERRKNGNPRRRKK